MLVNMEYAVYDCLDQPAHPRTLIRALVFVSGFYGIKAIRMRNTSGFYATEQMCKVISFY